MGAIHGDGDGDAGDGDDAYGDENGDGDGDGDGDPDDADGDGKTNWEENKTKIPWFRLENIGKQPTDRYCNSSIQ